ncbi:fanconi anemia complementation group M protein [Aphanothece sacrum FPU1]|uniref:Fanconi anemia complementation group M protein n=1 Tax=Aphanothece sacrum FPU1 TaxID=1920663 RepID=A0A401IGI4_APHSA|nr:fanconi anemia complementation group M protein [Aphanothece sacrum FPU1]GBF84898.1 hypothetical protein AsFPU3_1953 [Aphanothece sacrum FPU3]
MNSIKIPAVKVNNAMIKTGAVERNFVKPSMNSSPNGNNGSNNANGQQINEGKLEFRYL